MPPSVASAPGSTGNQSPRGPAAASSCDRVTPALHRRGEIVRAERDDRVHARQVETDSAVQRDHVPFEARSGAERHDRHAGRVRVLEHSRNFFGRFREDDDVGAMRRVIGEVAGVLVEDRVAVADAAFVRDEPEQLRAQIGGDRHDRRLDARCSDRPHSG